MRPVTPPNHKVDRKFSLVYVKKRKSKERGAAQMTTKVKSSALREHAINKSRRIIGGTFEVDRL